MADGRHLTQDDLQGTTAVQHLAALSNDLHSVADNFKLADSA